MESELDKFSDLIARYSRFPLRWRVSVPTSQDGQVEGEVGRLGIPSGRKSLISLDEKELEEEF